MDGYMKIIKSIETSKQRLQQMRAQKAEIEDEISNVIQKRCLIQVKTNSLKQEGHEVDATAEMILNREFEQKKAELAQIQDQTSKSIRDARNRGAERNGIEKELKEVKNIVSTFNSGAGKVTSTSDLKELIPREIAKVKRALQ